MWLVAENGGQGSTGKYISCSLFSGIWKNFFWGLVWFGLVWIKVGEIYKKKNKERNKHREREELLRRLEEFAWRRNSVAFLSLSLSLCFCLSMESFHSLLPHKANQLEMEFGIGSLFILKKGKYIQLNVKKF